MPGFECAWCRGAGQYEKTLFVAGVYGVPDHVPKGRELLPFVDKMRGRALQGQSGGGLEEFQVYRGILGIHEAELAVREAPAGPCLTAVFWPPYQKATKSQEELLGQRIDEPLPVSRGNEASMGFCHEGVPSAC